MKSIPLFLVAACAAALTLAMPSSAATPNLGRSGTIAFDAGLFPDGFAPYFMNPDGTNVRQFPAAGGEMGQLAWAPDGQRVAFHEIDGPRSETAPCHIYVSNPDGSGKRRVTNGAGCNASPSWSPDGTRIAFDTNRDGQFDIWIANADGSGESRLTTDAADESFPSWSPDGTTIAFESWRNSDANIAVINSDGTNQRILTNNSEHDIVPRWSPSGKQISFARYGDIWVMNADGSNQHALTTGASEFPWDLAASWSPNGAALAFSRMTSDDVRDIYTMNADGSAVKRLGGVAGKHNIFPNWQPPLCTIKQVIDGDSFECADGTVVDMLQIDAPEPGACGGDWAKAALQYIFLPPGRTVALAYDSTISAGSGATLAAPIWLGNDGTDYNLSIVMAYVGLARASIVGAGNTKNAAWTSASETWAAVAQWNMWAPGKPFNGGC